MYPDPSQNLTYETDDAIYFMSHAYDVLNPWSAHQVKVWGITFPTVEHAYHYRKFSDRMPALAKKILQAPSPWAAMQIERQYKTERRKDWEDIKLGVMAELLRAMVAQNDDVRECLLATGNKSLVKNSPFDEYWGSGRAGKGGNQMGKLFMQIREELRKGSNEDHKI